MEYPKSGPVTLRTNLADYAMTKALKSGAVKSDLVTFDFCGPKVANQGFKAMVRERKFDAGELAIGTFLEAKTYGKPVTLLPAVVMGRFQHQCALRSTFGGSTNSARWPSSLHTHLTLFRSTPYSCCRMPRTQMPVVCV